MNGLLGLLLGLTGLLLGVVLALVLLSRSERAARRRSRGVAPAHPEESVAASTEPEREAGVVTESAGEVVAASARPERGNATTGIRGKKRPFSWKGLFTWCRPKDWWATTQATVRRLTRGRAPLAPRLRPRDRPSAQATQRPKPDRTGRRAQPDWQAQSRPVMQHMLGRLNQRGQLSTAAASQDRNPPAFSRAILVLIVLVILVVLAVSLWWAGLGNIVAGPKPQFVILIATLPGSTESQSSADLLAQLQQDLATAGLSSTVTLRVIPEQPANPAAAYNLAQSRQADMLLWGQVRGDLFPGYFLTLTLAPRFQSGLALEFAEYSLVMATPTCFPLNRVGNRGLAKVALARSLTWLALFYTGQFDRLDSLPSAEVQGNVPRALLQFHWMALRWLDGDYEGVKKAYADLGCPVEFVPAETPLSPRQVAERQVCLAAANNRAVTLITQEGLGQLPASALDGATATLASIVEVAPDLTVAWYNLGRAYLARGKWGEALRALDKTVQQAPNMAAAWAALSEASTEVGDLPRAQESAARARSLDSGLVTAYLSQGRYLLARNQLQEAERILEEALQLAKAETIRRRSQEAALREGPQANARRADFAAAWARRNNAVVARVHLARARVFLRQYELEGEASVFLWLWRWIIGELPPRDKAETEIQAALATHPEWSAVLRLRAQLLIARGALEDAVAMLRTLQEQDPYDLEIYLDLVEVLRQQLREYRRDGRTTEAQQKLAELRAQYRLLIDREIAPALGYFGLGDVAQEVEEWDVARESYLQAVAVDTQYAEAYVRLAQVELHTPNEPLALAYLDRALAAAEEKGAVAVAAYCERGEILLEQHLRAQVAGGEGPLADAQKAFEAARTLDGRAVRALNGLGRIAYENGDIASAESLYHQAQAAAAHNFDTLYGLGRVYEARGQSYAARDYLLQATGMRADSIAARYHLGVAYYALQDEVLARQQWERVQEACTSLDQQKRPKADDTEACARVDEWIARLSGESARKLRQRGETMMTTWTEYRFPKTVEEALEMLAAQAGMARIIAGGTDLVLQAQQGKCTSTVMVDVTGIPGLDFLEERDGTIWIGPQVTHAQVTASPLVRERAGVLAVGCGSVGGPQIRNVATLVGNVVNAMPAADGAVALFALDAEVEVAETAGRRFLPIVELYAGVGLCTLNPCAQMVTGIRFRPLPTGWGWSFKRLAQRRALILPMLNTAVVVQVAEGRFQEVRIAIGPVAATPMRACEAEMALRGRTVSTAAIAEAARLAMEAAHPRDSAVRGSGEYRRAMVEVLVRRGLEEAAVRARG